MQFSERELPPFPRRKGIEYNCPDLLLFVYAIERHWIILSAYCLYYFNVYKIFFYFYEVTWDCSYPQNYYLYDFKILFQEFSYNEVYEEPNPSDGKWSENHSVVSDFTNPWTVCSLPDSSIHGILQARILEWVASPGDLPNPRIREPRSPTLQANSLPAEPPGKPSDGKELFFSLLIVVEHNCIEILFCGTTSSLLHILSIRL